MFKAILKAEPYWNKVVNDLPTYGDAILAITSHYRRLPRYAKGLVQSFMGRVELATKDSETGYVLLGLIEEVK